MSGMYHHGIDRDYSVNLGRAISLNTLVLMEIFHLSFIWNLASC